MIHTGDCIEVMAGMAEASVDAVVTDPPYGLEFMGKEWDSFKTTGVFAGGGRAGNSEGGNWNAPRYIAGSPFQQWCEAWGRAALRVTVPGGYLLAFGGTRTHHRLVCGLEDAGWIIRDELDWIYACLSDDTEILTDRGWQPYNGVSTNDTALAFDTATGALRWEPVQAVHRYTHEGEMVRLHGAGTDQLVTLNHRLVLVDGQGLAPLSGVSFDLLASRGMAAPGIQGTVLLEAVQRDATYPRSSVPPGAVMERRAQGEGSHGDAWTSESGLEGWGYRVQEARELLGRALRAGPGLGEADGPQGRIHHGAPPTDGGPVRLPDDQGRGGQPREPRSDGQPPRELDALAIEPRPQAVRMEQTNRGWRLVPTAVSAELVDYAGMVWCITVPSGAFVARRRGLAFVTGNSGFPKGRANLKPAHEPIVLARKPGPLQPLAIDACRIGNAGVGYVQPRQTTDVDGASWSKGEHKPFHYDDSRKGEASADRRYTESGSTDLAALPGPRGGSPSGRWPSNVLLQDPELFDVANPDVVGSGAVASSGVMAGGTVRKADVEANKTAYGLFGGNATDGDTYGDSGGYSRFFIVPKSSRSDREPIITPEGHDRSKRFSTHPTQKPTDLMTHLIKLVCPTDGVILDPFLGSGSTAIAAERLGVKWIGIEKEPEYVAIAEARLNGVQRGMGLVG